MLVPKDSFRWDHPFPRTGCTLNCGFYYTKMDGKSLVIAWTNRRKDPRELQFWSVQLCCSTRPVLERNLAPCDQPGHAEAYATLHLRLDRQRVDGQPASHCDGRAVDTRAAVLEREPLEAPLLNRLSFKSVVGWSSVSEVRR